MFVNNVKKLVIRVISCTRRVHSLHATRTHTNHGKRLGQWNESKIGVVHGEAKIERGKAIKLHKYILLFYCIMYLTFVCLLWNTNMHGYCSHQRVYLCCYMLFLNILYDENRCSFSIKTTNGYGSIHIK